MGAPKMTLAAQRMAPAYPLRPVSFERVTLTDAFWLPRLNTQRRVLVPYAFQQTEEALNDLRAAAAVLASKQSAEKLSDEEAAKIPGPHRYRTSDLFKVMEGAAYLLAIERDPDLERQMDEIIATIAAAQEPDGYLNATRTLYPHAPIRMMGDDRYAYVDHSHELYIVGHMYEAAVAYYRATGKRTLLDVAERNAQHVQRVFFEGDPAYNGGKPVNQAPGHEEIELALVKLAAATGNPDYLKTAQRFLDIRGVTYVPQGEGVFSATYNQQHKPVTEQAEPVGHAVRATYLYAGMADVGAMLGIDRYNDALERIWRNIVDTRMHITGGLGAVHGIEGFGPEYELPNADAFNETCAAVGNVFFNWRMFLLHRDGRYLDVAELALYNNVLAGVNLDGDRFFYLNPLAADGARPFNHGRPERSPWFGTACCPTNIARLVPQVPGMIFAADDDGLTLCLYAASRTSVELGGVPTELVEETSYPYGGRVKLTLTPERPTKFAVRLRLPTWTTDRLVPGELYRYADACEAPVQLYVNGEPQEVKVENGFATVEREWSPGDEIILELPMPVRASVCRDEVEANRGRIAISRGPLVYCLESADNPGHAYNYLAPSEQELAAAELEKLNLHGHETTAIKANSQRLSGGELEPAPITLIPYYAWNNRGVTSMAVWLPTDAETLRRGAIVIDDNATRFKSAAATHTFEQDSAAAMIDGRLPKNSADASIPRWTSWPERGKPQTLDFVLNKPVDME
ncbi:MAG TPA: beta-L-arabinofuranosidase domain-containing protein, partial [Lacipirellula sp.]